MLLWQHAVGRDTEIRSALKATCGKETSPAAAAGDQTRDLPNNNNNNQVLIKRELLVLPELGALYRKKREKKKG